jgi:uncharacterized protein YjbI with pentapeptide repeats
VIGTSGDIVAGDVVGIAGSGVFTGSGAKNVGSGKSVQFSGARLSGSDALNYTLQNGSGSTTADITPKPLSASYAGVSKVYDGSAVAVVTGSSSDIVTNDQLIIAASGTFTGASAADAGTAKPITVSGGNLSGADASNYSLSNPTGSANADITPLKVTVTPKSFARTAGDANPLGFDFSTTPGSLVNDDHIAFIDASVPAQSVGAAGVSLFDITATGAVFDRGNPNNYQLSYKSGRMVVLQSPTTQSGDLVAFLDADLQALADGAPQALDQALAIVSQPGSGSLKRRLNNLVRPVDLPAPADDPATSGAQVTLPTLQRTPLISFDPAMRRLVNGKE